MLEEVILEVVIGVVVVMVLEVKEVLEKFFCE